MFLFLLSLSLTHPHWMSSVWLYHCVLAMGGGGGVTYNVLNIDCSKCHGAPFSVHSSC